MSQGTWVQTPPGTFEQFRLLVATLGGTLGGQVVGVLGQPISKELLRLPAFGCHFGLVLSCLVLSFLVLPFLVLSLLVLFGLFLVLSRLALSCLVGWWVGTWFFWPAEPL